MPRAAVPTSSSASSARPVVSWAPPARLSSYGRGLLAESRGLPEGIVDVIPADLVVAAIIAVAGRGPDAAGPTVYQAASGARNPLRYRRLVDLVREWFTDHPIYDSHGQ